MKKTLLLFAACASVALAIAAPLTAAGYSIVADAGVYAMPLAAFAAATLAVWTAPAVMSTVARYVKQALAMSLQPGGRSPAVALIAAKARMLRTISRKQIAVTGSWRMCPSA